MADEKTCMQFSIRRPKLPSSETHPEESAHRRLDVPAWLGHLNELGQVEEEHKLRKVRLARAAAPCAERCPPRARQGRRSGRSRGPVWGPATAIAALPTPGIRPGRESDTPGGH